MLTTKTIAACLLTVCLVAAGLLAACPAGAAPMREQRYTVEGTIASVDWHPKQLVVPGKPMFPCSPSKPYYKSGFYYVVLKDAKFFQPMPGYARPPHPLPNKNRPDQMDLHINHPADNLGLKPGMRLRVDDYTINGDECAMWFGFRGLRVLGSPGALKQRLEESVAWLTPATKGNLARGDTGVRLVNDTMDVTLLPPGEERHYQLEVRRPKDKCCEVTVIQVDIPHRGPSRSTRLGVLGKICAATDDDALARAMRLCFDVSALSLASFRLVR